MSGNLAGGVRGGGVKNAGTLTLTNSTVSGNSAFSSGGIQDAENTLTVTVNGSTSATVDGVTVSNIAVDSSGNVTADIVAACGATAADFTLRVTDSGGLHAEATLHVAVTAETTPPVINLNPATLTLFPPNHHYVTFQVSQLVSSVSDNCSAVSVADVVIEKATSDEPDNGGGDGNTINDIVIAADCRSVNLRAERAGNGDGRVYNVTLRLRDAAGNTARATKKVTVAKSQGARGPIEGKTAFTVTSSCP